MRIDDRLFGALVCLLGIAILWHSSGFPEVGAQYYGPAMFPYIIGGGFVVSGGWLLASGLQKSRAHGGLMSFPDWRGPPRRLAGVALMLVSILAFIFLGDRIGFQILSFATLIAMYVVAGRRLLQAAAIALVVTLCLDLLFTRLLRVPLPSGLLRDILWW